MVVLSANVNKIALLRNSRDHGCPDVSYFSTTCIQAGAKGITVHPRPDLRHITPSDIRELSKTIDVEFNMEGNPFSGAYGEDYPGFLALVREVVPTQCTLVPDSIDQKTSDHGWDLQQEGDGLRPIVSELQQLGCRVSLFVDPQESVIRDAAALGVDRIELYTESYARAFERQEGEQSFSQYAAMATLAQELSLGVNAGHDLTLENLPLFATLPGLLEVSIGHALIADALKMGMSDAVKAYLACLG